MDIISNGVMIPITNPYSIKVLVLLVSLLFFLITTN